MGDWGHLVIAAGGTGGHMFPAQALAAELLSRGWRVTLSTDERGARYAGGFPDAVTRTVIPSATFARGGIAAKAIAPFRILKGISAATLGFRKDRPTVVAGFGGYPSIPALAAATLLGIPRLIHEQNGVLGRVNKAFARRVDAVACGTWPTVLPEGVKAIHTGNPVRAEILEKAAAPLSQSGTGAQHVLVMGGSQGARILSDIVPGALARLPSHILEKLTVSHQARPEDQDRVKDVYAKAQIRAEVEPFFHDIPKRIAEAQLVVSRSGASSIADISVIGRPSILIPLATAMDDHQTANARGLVDAEAAILIPEHQLDPAGLAEQMLMVLSNPTAAAQMRENAVQQGMPDAADRLASLVESLAEAQATLQKGEIK